MNRRRRTPPARDGSLRYLLWFAWTMFWSIAVGLVAVAGGGVVAALILQAVGGPQ